MHATPASVPQWSHGAVGPTWAAPKRKSSPAAIIIPIVCVVLLFFLGTVGIFALTFSSDTSAADDYDYPTYDTSEYSPTYPSDDSSYSTGTTYTETTSYTDEYGSGEEPDEYSTDEYGTDEYTTTTTTETAPQPVAALGNHPFNIQGNGAVTTSCNLPPFGTDVASQRAFLKAAAPCLMQMWTPALREANLPVNPPNVIVTGQTINSPCGRRSWKKTAMYCPSNHTIYWTARHYARIENRSRAGVYLGQFAHEFGHALQGMIGIDAAYYDAVYEAGGFDTATGLRLSRRLELQATCFGGAALAALQNGGVDNSIIMVALRDASNRGDEYAPVRSHGTVAHNAAWVKQGFFKNRIVQCNTWLADASEVS